MVEKADQKSHFLPVPTRPDAISVCVVIGCRRPTTNVRACRWRADAASVLVIVISRRPTADVRTCSRRTYATTILVIVIRGCTASNVRASRSTTRTVTILVVVVRRRSAPNVRACRWRADATTILVVITRVVLCVSCDGEYDSHQCHHYLFHNPDVLSCYWKCCCKIRVSLWANQGKSDNRSAFGTLRSSKKACGK